MAHTDDYGPLFLFVSADSSFGGGAAGYGGYPGMPGMPECDGDEEKEKKFFCAWHIVYDMVSATRFCSPQTRMSQDHTPCHSASGLWS